MDWLFAFGVGDGKELQAMDFYGWLFGTLLVLIIVALISQKMTPTPAPKNEGALKVAAILVVSTFIAVVAWFYLRNLYF